MSSAFSRPHRPPYRETIVVLVFILVRNILETSIVSIEEFTIVKSSD